MGKKNVLDLFLILDDNVFIGKIFSLLKFEPNQYDKYDDINLGYFWNFSESSELSYII